MIDAALRIEKEHSRLKDPKLWANLHTIRIIPEYMRKACIIKHDLQNPEFCVLRDKKTAYMVCYAQNQVYINKGSGWMWLGPKSTTLIKAKHKITCAY